jgi:hypothetical protein
MAMESKRDKSEFHSGNFRHAHKDIACKTCALKATEVNGIKLNRADTSSCQKYRYPKSKPQAVIFNGAPCEHYIKG